MQSFAGQSNVETVSSKNASIAWRLVSPMKKTKVFGASWSIRGETVIRSDGGLGESVIRTYPGWVSDKSGWWGNSEQTCPSSPTPTKAMSMRPAIAEYAAHGSDTVRSGRNIWSWVMRERSKSGSRSTDRTRWELLSIELESTSRSSRRQNRIFLRKSVLSAGNATTRPE